MKDNAQLINQTSTEVEWYTRRVITDAARVAMGGIDLDPASCLFANTRVQAISYFDRLIDGIKQEWHGRVWFNHPFGRAEEACKPDCQKHLKNKNHKHHDYDLYGSDAWIQKLETEFREGRTIEACCITFAATSEAWFRPLLQRPQCFIHGRNCYETETGEPAPGCTKGSVVTYYGPHVDRFKQAFQALGTVKGAL